MMGPAEDMTNHKNAEIIGHPTTRHNTNKAEGDDFLFNEALQLNNIHHSGINARQAFQLLKQNQQPVILPVPYWCSLPAPNEINVYTDGSWLFPLKQFLGLGGAGVWWPERSLTKKQEGQPYHPLSKAENDIAFHQQSNEGVRLYTKIGGYGGSSTRTELAAGIIAVCAHGPVHIGSDSKAFVDTANVILQDITKGRKPHKPWKLVSDGDLWDHFHQAVISKGVESLKITWVKGHATQDHIDKGITTLKNKLGNDEADAVADIGTALHGQDIMTAAKCLQKRHHDYQVFMCDVSHHIVESYLIHRELTKRIEAADANAAKHLDKRRAYNPLPYPSSNAARPLKATSCLKEYTAYRKKHDAATNIEHFLANLLVVRKDEMRGITWLELYILFRCRGYPKPIPDPEQAAKQKPTPAKQINAFKKHMRGIVKRSLHDSMDANLFRPSPPTLDALIGAGITGKHATLCFNTAITTAEQQCIAKCLAKLNRTISNKHANEFINGEQNLVPYELKLKGKVGWDSTIPILTHKDFVSTSWEPPRQDEYHPAQPNTAFFECPNCLKVEPSSCKDFQYNDLDIKHTCFMCNKHSAVKNWRCACGTRWYGCTTHRYNTLPATNLHMSKTANGQPASASVISKCNRKRKWQGHSASFDDILADDFKRADRKNDPHGLLTNESVISLGICPHTSVGENFLGPILKKRFYGR